MMSTIATAAPEIAALIEAAWQVLDDMDVSDTSCCVWAKAQLRVALEPFANRGTDDELPFVFPLAEAVAIMEDVARGQ